MRPEKILKLLNALAVIRLQLSLITTKAMLILVFYVMMTPLSFLTKLAGIDSFGLRRRGSRSYWQDRKKTRSVKDSLEKQY